MAKSEITMNYWATPVDSLMTVNYTHNGWLSPLPTINYTSDARLSSDDFKLQVRILYEYAIMLN